MINTRLSKKKDINELLEQSNLPKEKKQLVLDANNLFNIKVKLSEISYDEGFLDLGLNIYDTDEYMEYCDLCNNLKHSINIFTNCTFSNSTYKLLDLILYSSLEIYKIHDGKSFELFEKYTDIAVFIINNFFNLINKDNFPVTYNYLIEMTQLSYSSKFNLNLIHLANIFKFKNTDTEELKDIDYFNLFRAFKHLEHKDFKYNLECKDIDKIHNFDFKNSSISSIETLLTVIIFLLKDENYNNFYLLPKIAKSQQFFKDLFSCLSKEYSYFNEKRDDLAYQMIDKKISSTETSAIIKTILDIPRNKLFELLGEEEYKTEVDKVLKDLAELIYYRQYQNNISLFKFDTLLNKEIEELSDIPF